MGIGLNLPITSGGSGQVALTVEDRTATSLKITPDNGTGAIIPGANASLSGLMNNKHVLVLNALTNFYRLNILNDIENDFTGLSAAMDKTFALITTAGGSRYLAIKNSNYEFDAAATLFIALEGIQYSFITTTLDQTLPNGIKLYNVPSTPSGTIPLNANADIPFIWYRLSNNNDQKADKSSTITNVNSPGDKTGLTVFGSKAGINEGAFFIGESTLADPTTNEHINFILEL